jgi:hypothetical protein
MGFVYNKEGRSNHQTDLHRVGKAEVRSLQCNRVMQYSVPLTEFFSVSSASRQVYVRIVLQIRA